MTSKMQGFMWALVFVIIAACTFLETGETWSRHCVWSHRKREVDGVSLESP